MRSQRSEGKRLFLNINFGLRQGRWEPEVASQRERWRPRRYPEPEAAGQWGDQGREVGQSRLPCSGGDESREIGRSRGLLCSGGDKSREGGRSRGLLGSGDGRRLPGVWT